MKEYSGIEMEWKRNGKELNDLKNIMKQEDISKRNADDRIRDLSAKTGEYQKIINELST